MRALRLFFEESVFDARGGFAIFRLDWKYVRSSERVEVGSERAVRTAFGSRCAVRVTELLLRVLLTLFYEERPLVVFAGHMIEYE